MEIALIVKKNIMIPFRMEKAVNLKDVKVMKNMNIAVFVRRDMSWINQMENVLDLMEVKTLLLLLLLLFLLLHLLLLLLLLPLLV